MLNLNIIFNTLYTESSLVKVEGVMSWISPSSFATYIDIFKLKEKKYKIIISLV